MKNEFYLYALIETRVNETFGGDPMSPTLFVISLLAGFFMFGVALFRMEGWISAVTLGFTAWMGVMCWLSFKRRKGVEAEALPRASEEVILEIIRRKGRARRRDFMPHVEMSKSTLVRMLDKMEEDGVIVQVGERKASYYRLGASKGEL